MHQNVRGLCCTGGGAHKFHTLFARKADDIELQTCDELDCTIKGLNFLLKLLPHEVYTFENVDFNSMTATKVVRQRENTDEDIYPYLVRNDQLVHNVKITTFYYTDVVGEHWFRC